MGEFSIKNEYFNLPGVCPKCHEIALDYEPMRREDDGMCWYPYKCEKCGLRGEEWYKLEFSGHNIYDENDNIIELDA